jgi:VIT1/CCC1 family predicted Fe2+/Mn2+ transporter
VLTFTLGASVELGGDREATRELLVAALGCNTAWGIIDAVLYLMNRLSERGRVHRLVRAIQSARSNEHALELVRRELDERIPGVVGPATRDLLDRDVLERVREMTLLPTRVTRQDLWVGLAVFWLVFLTALPAVLPFLVIPDARIAVRVSNAILVAALFYTGWRWATYTGASPWRTAVFVALLAVGLVVVAIALGG